MQPISLELLTVSENDDSLVDFVHRPLDRDFLSDDIPGIASRFVPLRTREVGIVESSNHSKLLPGDSVNPIHRDLFYNVVQNELRCSVQSASIEFHMYFSMHSTNMQSTTTKMYIVATGCYILCTEVDRKNADRIYPPIV